VYVAQSLADAFKSSHGDVQVKHRELNLSKPLEIPAPSIGDISEKNEAN
jgi:hypothetical protein